VLANREWHRKRNRDLCFIYRYDNKKLIGI
jgi:hypothetical protein